IEAAVTRVRERWELPDGQPLADAPRRWAVLRELATGFYYRWIERPPDEWLEARRAWCKVVRETISRSRGAYDTELQVWRACERGLVDSAGVFARWRELRPTFEPETEPVWIDESVIIEATSWLASGGIAWVTTGALGERLSAASGVPYYRSGSRAARYGVEESTEPVILSVSACGEGLNLQRYARNLVVSPDFGGKTDR